MMCMRQIMSLKKILTRTSWNLLGKRNITKIPAYAGMTRSVSSFPFHLSFFARIFLSLIICSLFIFSTNISWAGEKEERPLTLILDWFANPDHAPIFVAQQEGFFKQQGITINIVNPADPSDPPKLVAAGKADLAVTYQPQLVEQVSQGLPLVRIATLISTPLNCLAIKADSSIKDISDLKGKTIGYSSDAIDKMAVSVILAKHGLAIKDVKLINVKFNLVQALLANKVDAITGIMRNFELIEMQLAGKPARAFYIEENGMPPYDELIIVTNRAELSDPRLPKFLTALELGAQYLVNHPEESWQKFAKAHPELNNELNHKAWLTTLPRFALSPVAMDNSRYQNLAVFLQQQGLIKTIPPVNTYAVQLPHT